MKIITINLNGIRSAASKGVFDWLKTQDADVICMQELKAQEKDLQNPALQMEGYHSYFHCAEKKGYSGVGIFTRHKPEEVTTGLGFPIADQEGRYIAIKLKNLSVASIYLPSGTSGEDRQAIKYEFLDKYEAYLRKLSGEHIICGDLNVAHKNIDLKNWKSNQKNSGFLPDERAWMDKLFGEMGFVDAFREVNQAAEEYTWWSFRRQSRAKNVGWRIDYQVVTPGLKSAVKSAMVYKDQLFSDHAPVVMEYDI